MYEIYCDDALVYSPRNQKFKIISATLDTELNKTGSFSFTLPADHPRRNLIIPMKSIIKVTYKDSIIFSGRVIPQQQDFYNRYTYTCEGALAYLLDSIQRPYLFPSDGQTGSPLELFTMLLDTHNHYAEAKKQFKRGLMTVSDSNDYIRRENSNYDSVWANLTSRLLDPLGGYLRVRYENDGLYLDYLAEYLDDQMKPLKGNQAIRFGENLIDFSRLLDTDPIATSLLPLGAKDEKTGQRITISSVNGGIDYISDNLAVNQYGKIMISETWDDVTVPENLLAKAQARLLELVHPKDTVDISAADLALAGYDYETFEPGQTVLIDSSPHNVHQELLITKLKRDLLHPEKSTLTLGGNYLTLTGQQAAKDQLIHTITSTIEKIEGEYTSKAETQVIVATQVTEQAGRFEAQFSEQFVDNDELQANISQIYADMNQISASFGKVGGNNLIRNSAGKGGTIGWAITGNVTTTQDQDIISNTSAKSAFLISGSMTQYIAVKPGELHTFNLLYQKNICHLTVKIGNDIIDSDDDLVIVDSTEQAGSWVFVSYPFTPAAGIICLKVQTDVPQAYLADMVLTEGLGQTWSQAANEVYATGFSADESGLRVMQSGTGTKTIIDATGTRVTVANNEQDTVAEFTSYGTRTKTLTSAGQISAGKVRLIPQPDGLMTVVND